MIRGNEWIMDGNYRSTLHMRIPASDTVIMLDFSRWTCLWRILKRRIKKDRRDCIVDCKERIDFELLIWILWKFPQVNRKEILKILKDIKSEKSIYVLKTDKEVEKFLSSII